MTGVAGKPRRTCAAADRKHGLSVITWQLVDPVTGVRCSVCVVHRSVAAAATAAVVTVLGSTSRSTNNSKRPPCREQLYRFVCPPPPPFSTTTLATFTHVQFGLPGGRPVRRPTVELRTNFPLSLVSWVFVSVERLSARQQLKPTTSFTTIFSYDYLRTVFPTRKF